MADEQIIARIRKCLALSKSGNEHEAAAALRQASKMMSMHAISDVDILASEATEESTKARSKSRPVRWEIALAQIIAGAFGCQYLFAGGKYVKQGQWLFVGCGSAPEIARYAFEVLMRQVLRARKEYIKNRLLLYTAATKTRRADLFCQGWIVSASEKVSSLAVNDSHKRSIDAYLKKNHSSMCEKNVKASNKKLSQADIVDLQRGARSGESAIIHMGVDGHRSPLALV